jgi:hypothetical protein
MDLHKHINSYINHVKKYHNVEHKHKIFEYLIAIVSSMLMWDDIPPDFCEKHNLPHRRDYGIDVLDINGKKTGQVKLYGKNSIISFKCLSTYLSYSKEILKIDDINLFTTPFAKIDSMIERISSLKTHRFDYDSLLKEVLSMKISENHKISDIKIEQRDYLIDCVSMINGDKTNLKFQLPPGTGKSFIAYDAIIKKKCNKNEKHIILVHRLQLAEQHVCLLKKLGVKVYVINGRTKKIKNDCDVFIILYQSVDKHLDEIMKNKILYKFCDEAHHIEDIDSEWRKNSDKIKCEKEIHLSATFKNQTDLDYVMTIRNAIDSGYISDYKIICEYFTNGDKMNSLANLIKERREWFPAFIYFNCKENAKKFNKKLQELEIKSDTVFGGRF